MFVCAPQASRPRECSILGQAALVLGGHRQLLSARPSSRCRSTCCRPIIRRQEDQKGRSKARGQLLKGKRMPSPVERWGRRRAVHRSSRRRRPQMQLAPAPVPTRGAALRGAAGRVLGAELVGGGAAAARAEQFAALLAGGSCGARGREGCADGTSSPSVCWQQQC